MSYVVLARKWRPQRFEDLVGQDHVARTLGNAIASGRVAHAFLFTGVRGVGKTSSARILAKALNCMGEPGTVAEGTDPGPTVTPCLKCPACIEITLGTDMDVREIDGASHNGVDEIRKLQDSLPYRPGRDRYKIIIVDEVHMLTAAAWNAFLKTLEEPPAHVKFIFATTEVHKVPITILSRVQRFDFKMIGARTIGARLRYVLDEEKIQADETAVALLARQASGSMRDAMSLLDQVIAFSGQKLEGEDVARVLGVANRRALYEIAGSLVGGRPEVCLKLIGELSDQGFDIPHLARDLLSLLRDLVVCKVCKNPSELLDLSDEEQADVMALSRDTQESDLLRLHQAFSKNFDEVVRGADPRASLEMLLVRLSLRPQLLPVDELLHRLAHLEKRLAEAAAVGGQQPAGAGPTRPASSGAPAAPVDASLLRGRPLEQSDAIAHRARQAEQRAPVQAPATRPQAEARERSPSAPRPAPSAEDSGDEGPPARPARNGNAEARPPRMSLGHPAPAFNGTAAEPIQASALAALPALGKSFAPPALQADELALLEVFWPVAERVRGTHMELAAYLEQAVPLGWDGQKLELGLEPGCLFEKQLLQTEALEVLRAALVAEHGPESHLQILSNVPEAQPHRTLAAERVRRRQARHDAAVEDVKNHPKVQEALSILGASIKTVRIGDA